MAVKTELECALRCPKCKGIPYRLYRRQVSEGSDIWENVLWPGPDGNPGPPQKSSELKCPHCDIDLVRE